MNTRRRLAERLEHTAGTLEAYHALADLHLRHDQIMRRNLAPEGWQIGISEAMSVLQRYLEAQLDTERREATALDDDIAGRVEVARTPAGRCTQLKIKIS